MFTCRACAHDDMVHFLIVGCCGVRGCPCEGMDGVKRCQKDEHGEACGWTTLREPAEADPKLVAAVLADRATGIGIKRLARTHSIRVWEVRQIVGRTAPADTAPAAA